MKTSATPRPLQRPALLLALLAACTLGGCFDDDDDEAPMPPVVQDSVPASATASPRAYTAFAGTLQASDSARPLQLGDYTPPTSETDAPLGVN